MRGLKEKAAANIRGVCDGVCSCLGICVKEATMTPGNRSPCHQCAAALYSPRPPAVESGQLLAVPESGGRATGAIKARKALASVCGFCLHSMNCLQIMRQSARLLHGSPCAAWRGLSSIQFYMHHRWRSLALNNYVGSRPMRPVALVFSSLYGGRCAAPQAEDQGVLCVRVTPF